MEITFYPAKNERNIHKHGLSFEKAAEFDFETAVFDEDMRMNYGENRIKPSGLSKPAALARFHNARIGAAGHQLAQGQPEGGDDL